MSACLLDYALSADSEVQSTHVTDNKSAMTLCLQEDVQATLQCAMQSKSTTLLKL